ncbi:hypothetical protein [Phenylobacterium sp. J367]|uniref:hypothetical protein n=1 Tax=Phenylobacterium sp. J367 TaxID=2898435 RepID=UPI00215154D4|nr:hypothetical protein [Phenylobacterium sp. J367]MCR5879423.1 hypothetical protein [Phenylobacterium sp. J367]
MALAVSAGAAQAADSGAGVAVAGARATASVGFEGPSDRLWTGVSTNEECVGPRRRRLLSLFQPAQRYAVAERRGELIGEFLTPTPAPQVVAAARSCAAAAGDNATARIMLAGGPTGLVRFQRAFSACMTQHDAGQAVGSLTLWVDNHCNW